MGKRKRKAGQRGIQKNFSKEHIDRIIAELLAEKGKNLNRWHTPNGNSTIQGKMVPIRFSPNQHEVVMYMCKQWNVSLAYMVKKLIVRQYFKESGWIEHIAKEIPQDVWDHLFSFAHDRIAAPEREYKPRTI